MKEKILFAMGGITLVATAIITISTINANRVTSDLMNKNLEALSQGEAVRIPCVQAADVCVFDVTQANGKPGTLRAYGMTESGY